MVALRSERRGRGSVMVATKARKAKKDDRFRELSREEGWALLDERARHYLKMSAEEFIRVWEAGDFENPDRPEVLRVAMLLPFVGKATVYRRQ